MSSFAADDFDEIGRIVRNRAAERIAQAAALVDGAPVELPQEESAVQRWLRLSNQFQQAATKFDPANDIDWDAIEAMVCPPGVYRGSLHDG